MNFNPVILITSHLDTKEKIKVASEQIRKFKEYTNIPLIHASNYPIDHDIQRLSDYNFSKENEISNRYSIMWNSINIGDKEGILKLIKKVPDYGYSHLELMLAGFKVGKSLGFNYIYHLNYDASLKKKDFDIFIQNGKDSNPMFYKYNLVNNDIRVTTILFSIPTDDFINALDKKLPLYKEGINETDFHLKPGWMCEEFFEWVFNGYYGYKIKPNSILYEDLIRSQFEGNVFYIKNNKFTYWIDTQAEKIWYFNVDNKHPTKDILLKNLNEQPFLLTYTQNNIFYSKIKEDSFYDKGEFIFKIDPLQLKNAYWVER